MTRTPPPPVAEVRGELGLPELARIVTAADPAAILVPPRILRRVIKQVASIAGIGLRVPHRKTYVISREELLAVVDTAELDLPAYASLADVVILLARPTPQQIGTLSADELLLRYWRLLFHARVHVAFEQLVAQGKFGPDLARRRASELGESEFAEVRAVLRQEDYLLPPKDEFSSYIEFAAVYLELRYFADDLLGSFFPELPELGRVDEIVGRDIDVHSLLAGTRLEGAADPQQHAGALRKAANRLAARARRIADERRPAGTSRRLLERARRAAERGNVVRAAIMRTQAMLAGSGDEARAARTAAHADLERLARRLHAACGFSTAEIEEWARALSPLVEASARGSWTPEARLLFDLQKVCIDHERRIYALNLWPWIRSLGREPLKRRLAGQRDVLMVKHLRGARDRLAAARLSDQHRRRLEALFETAVHHTERSLRARFRPAIDQALNRVRLVAQNLPERVARRKLVDELLDRIVERGFLSMGDLRDAFSRNNLKLPDLDVTSFKQWLLGDQLLLADRELAITLDGVYRRGEIYLRLPQRLSSLAFGARLGRLLTLYAIIPFGGAYLTLVFAHHLKTLVERYGLGSAATAPDAEAAPHGQLSLWLGVAALGLVFEGLMHHRRFRSFCLEFAWTLGLLARRAFVELPARLLKLPLVRALLASPYFRALERYVLKPALISVLLTAGVSLYLNRRTTLESAGMLFVVANVLLNSRFGRNVDELVTDWIAHAWHRLRIHVLAALYRFIIELFQRILETIERLLYTVDEWLRFKAGESPATTLAKAVLTPVWRVIDYVIRIFVNVLIEPQINPIKHFPVVTVAHKILLPFSKVFTDLLAAPLGTYWAVAIASPTILLLPGMFGFLVWELKENWRLYAANRPRELQPAIVGHHGETIIRFLRPGFRSGTLPKLYAKLRKADRLAFATGQWKSAGKQRAGLHGVEEHLRRFVERELIMLVAESHGWQSGPLSVGEIELGTNRILFELYAPELAERSLWISLEEHAGWLVAGIHRRGWLDRLSRRGRVALANALAGFYKLAGVDLVREQLDAQLEPGAQHYDIDERGLIVHGPGEIERVYPLRDWPPGARADEHWPLELGRPGRRELAFACAPISWQRWLEAWRQDVDDEVPSQPYLAGVHFLPNRS